MKEALQKTDGEQVERISMEDLRKNIKYGHIKVRFDTHIKRGEACVVLTDVSSGEEIIVNVDTSHEGTGL